MSVVGWNTYQNHLIDLLFFRCVQVCKAKGQPPKESMNCTLSTKQRLCKRVRTPICRASTQGLGV